jgi:hypothetical protein
MAKRVGVIMGHATIAVTDPGGFIGARFPNVSEFEGQQQYPESQSSSDHSSKGIISKSLELQGVIERAASVAPTDSTAASR